MCAKVEDRSESNTQHHIVKQLDFTILHRACELGSHERYHLVLDLVASMNDQAV